MTTVLLLGSADDVICARDWPRAPFDHIVAINNAWAVRTDWDVMIHPYDFPADRMPPAPRPGQRIVSETEFVPANNAFGGFVYAGGTMAFTAGYWALHHYRPQVLAYLGCDMIYAPSGDTHFYGAGAADPLRRDITLRSLEAKSARLMVMAAMQGTAVVNLSRRNASRLVFPRTDRAKAALCRPQPWCANGARRALHEEAQLGYVVPSGRYWEQADRFEPDRIDTLDQMWLAAARPDAAWIA